MTKIVLNAGSADLHQLADIYWNEIPAKLDPGARPAVEAAAERIAAALAAS